MWDKLLTREEISSELFRASQKVAIHNNVIHVSKMVDTTAFFPGGTGFWSNSEASKPDIMVIGQDFGMESDYLNILNGFKKDTDTPTWKNLIKLFESTNIDLNRCFYTNAYMGLRTNGTKIGQMPGSNNNSVFQSNRDFLAYQIHILKPKYIITLGSPSAVMLGSLSDDISDWVLDKKFSYYDTAQRSLVKNVVIKKEKFSSLKSIFCDNNVNFENHKFDCLRLVHTCFRHLNIKNRSFPVSSNKHTANQDPEIDYLEVLFNKY